MVGVIVGELVGVKVMVGVGVSVGVAVGVKIVMQEKFADMSGPVEFGVTTPALAGILAPKTTPLVLQLGIEELKPIPSEKASHFPPDTGTGVAKEITMDAVVLST